jgi:DNA transformation protein and related proteins
MSSKATADHSVELLSSLGPIKQRAMFGGYGLYAEGVIVGLVAFDRLFLKTDALSRPHFIAAACLPFTYEGKGKTVVMSYYEPPAEAFDSSAAMQPWARLAIEAALRSVNAKPKKTGVVRSAKKTAKSAK